LEDYHVATSCVSSCIKYQLLYKYVQKYHLLNKMFPGSQSFQGVKVLQENFHTLTQLTARELFIEFCGYENFETYSIIYCSTPRE